MNFSKLLVGSALLVSCNIQSHEDKQPDIVYSEDTTEMAERCKGLQGFADVKLGMSAAKVRMLPSCKSDSYLYPPSWGYSYGYTGDSIVRGGSEAQGFEKWVGEKAKAQELKIPYFKIGEHKVKNVSLLFYRDKLCAIFIPKSDYASDIFGLESDIIPMMISKYGEGVGTNRTVVVETIEQRAEVRRWVGPEAEAIYIKRFSPVYKRHREGVLYIDDHESLFIFNNRYKEYEECVKSAFTKFKESKVQGKRDDLNAI